ncbi:hypothetical protein Bca52824_014043 [Brassica carinata]|uniref:Uncharacterized protein n=1 Tax=Brassica carinata TaxID=52824 RepID=A0A8X8B320_BRACI|nr:hypothetical protein Bca52824_014043 [Brassica carinata]
MQVQALSQSNIFVVLLQFYKEYDYESLLFGWYRLTVNTLYMGKCGEQFLAAYQEAYNDIIINSQADLTHFTFIINDDIPDAASRVVSVLKVFIILSSPPFDIEIKPESYEDDKAEAPEDEMVVKEHVVEKNQNWNRSLKNRRRRRDFETSIKPYSKKALVRNRNMKR